MLSVTDSAATEIRNLVAQPDVPDEGGVRIAGNEEGSLTLAVTAGPASGDDVVEAPNGAKVFVEETASQVLSDKTLDAATDQEGNLQFSIGQA